MFRKFSIILLLFTLIISAFALPTSFAQEATGSTSGELNVRTGPDTSNAKLTTIPGQTPVVIEFRNDIGDWVIIRTLDGSVRGWVASRFIFFDAGFSVQSLATSNERFTPSQGESGGGGEGAAPSVPSDLQPIVDRLYSIPVLHNMAGGGAYGAWARGRARGNRADVWTRVGDSITASQPFMFGFGQGNYDLGSYGYLQDTVNFFNQTPPRDGFANSFAYESEAAKSAFNASAVLWHEWASPGLCNANESPLLCEYRLSKPSIAIIMFGSLDVQLYDLALFRDTYREVIRQTIEAGVIPVVNTVPMRSDYIYYPQGMAANAIILDIAAEFNIPVINLWRALQDLPFEGTRDDRFHLSQGDTYYVFDGSENEFGVTLRNLLTLQALHEIRVNVLG